MRWALPLVLLPLVACGPVSPEVAVKQCTEEARRAAGPTGEFGIGVNSDGDAVSSVTIGVSSDFLTGRDPEQVYRSCVFRKTGGDPIRPLEL